MTKSDVQTQFEVGQTVRLRKDTATKEADEVGKVKRSGVDTFPLGVEFFGDDSVTTTLKVDGVNVPVLKLVDPVEDDKPHWTDATKNLLDDDEARGLVNLLTDSRVGLRAVKDSTDNEDGTYNATLTNKKEAQPEPVQGQVRIEVKILRMDDDQNHSANYEGQTSSEIIAEHINDGWRVAHEDVRSFKYGESSEWWRTVRLEREVIDDGTGDDDDATSVEPDVSASPWTVPDAVADTPVDENLTMEALADAVYACEPGDSMPDVIPTGGGSERDQDTKPVPLPDVEETQVPGSPKIERVTDTTLTLGDMPITTAVAKFGARGAQQMVYDMIHQAMCAAPPAPRYEMPPLEDYQTIVIEGTG